MKTRLWRIAASMFAAAGALIGTAAHAALSIDTVSSRPDLVGGTSALIVIRGATTPPKVTWDPTSAATRDISKFFAPDPNTPGQWIGLIFGFWDGKNKDIIEVTSGGETAKLSVVSHALNRSVFSGPLQWPFICELDSLGMKPTLNALTDPTRDTDCLASTTYTYFYKNKGGEWKPFDAKNRPTDIATSKIDGKDIPLIVRQEKGVINRSGYIINILHDPAAGPVPSYLSKGGSAWNGKLVYSFGPGARAGYHQGRNFGGLLPTSNYIEEAQVGAMDAWIARGYAVASGSLNSFGTSTNDVVSAETAYRVKEQFIKQYGVPIYTLGAGVSGGSMQQQMIANAYPGILDGIVPHLQFADAMTFQQPMFDCELLANVFKQGTWTRPQMEAISGMYWGYCVSNAARYPALRVNNCDQAVADAVAAIAELKTAGVRCTYQDNMEAVFGIDPKTGHARSPWDNVGVQYGLKALNDGVITMDQFIDINTRIGGHDIDGKIVAQRAVGDPEALRIAFATGRVNLATGGLAAIPQVATREYRDGDPFGRGDANVDVHAAYGSLVVQARLQKYLGTTGTNVYLMTAAAPGNANTTTPGSAANVAYLDALNGIDKWIMAIKADKSNRSPTEKVVANKPAELVDACYATKDGGATGGPIEKITDKARCDKMFPATSDPRIAAGGPMTDDVFKCQLKPIDVKDYKTAPTADQLAQLRKAFPDGVCDYSKPGVGQEQKLTTWAKFRGDGTFTSLIANR
ncbi:MAG: DUF6351 family protein [Bauldia sp.]